MAWKPPGLYAVNVQATDQQGDDYTDAVTVQVLDRTELDALLQAKWADMKAGLAAGDVQAALAYFSSATRSAYEDSFTALGDRLPQVAAQMGAIEMITAWDGFAKYYLTRSETHQGQLCDITYDLYFECNEKGRV